MLLRYVFIYFLLISTQGFSQINRGSIQKDTIYANELNQRIDRAVFEKKVTSKLYNTLIYEGDSLVTLVAKQSYMFGKINSENKSEIFRLFNLRNNVDTTKTIVIHYLDTLKRIDQFPKKDIIVSLKNGRHKHVNSHKTFIKNHKTCLNNFKNRKFSKVYHFFKVNNGHPLTYKKYSWEKDYGGLINKIFPSNYNKFTRVIISPDGDFFVYDRVEFPKTIYNDIIKGVNWEKHIQNYTTQMKILNNE